MTCRMTQGGLTARLAGIGLPEVLTALVLLSVGMLAVMTLMAQGIMLTRTELQSRHDARIAADMAEWAAMQPFTDPDLHEQLELELQQRNSTHQPAVYTQ